MVIKNLETGKDLPQRHSKTCYSLRWGIGFDGLIVRHYKELYDITIWYGIGIEYSTKYSNPTMTSELIIVMKMWSGME